MNDKHTEPTQGKTSIDAAASKQTAEQTSKAMPKTAPEKESKKKQGSKRTPRRWPFFVLAFVVGSATSIFTLNYYQLFHHTAPVPTATVLTSTEKAAVEKISVESIPVESMPNQLGKKFTEPTVETSKTSIRKSTFDSPARTAISSEEGVALMHAINALQNNIQGLNNALQDELQTLHQKQRDVADSQAMLESMQLHSRLSWIMQPNSHLPQIKLAWQEISLLPSLNSEQRILAESMLKLAQKRQHDVEQWQQEIDHLISSFKASEYQNIIADVMPVDSANPWLDWLTQQFSLKRSASSEDMLLLALKNRLLHIKQGMELEQWPTATGWAELRAQLQLRLVEQAGENTMPILQLPENFTAIKADVEQLRQTAQTWLEE